VSLGEPAMVGRQYSESTMASWLFQFGAAADRVGSSWALAGACWVCRGWSSGAVCEACIGRYTPLRARCQGCAIEVPALAVRCGECLQSPPPQSRTLAALDYAYPWDGLIQRFKYRQCAELARPLAARMQGPVAQALSQGLARPDWLVPVPLSPARLRERGYNQAWELCRRLSRVLAIPSRADTLWRLGEVPQQQGQSRAQRLAQARQAYAVAPRAQPLLRGTRVAVVDDVLTTGATAQAVAATLLRAGVAEVQVWVLARTPQ